MKEHGIKVLYGILAFGILISIFHILNDKSGSGLVNVIDTFTITSIILILSIFIFSSFNENRKNLLTGKKMENGTNFEIIKMTNAVFSISNDF
jgi:hypothetical protein